MRLLITGANGLVGSALCREALRRGHEVFALAREGASTGLVPIHATIIRGEFHRADDARRIIGQSQPDAVLHAAAVVSSGAPDLEKSLRVNVDGTRILALAAREAGVQRWLQVSSMSAHAGNLAVYGGTKMLADLAVFESGIPCTIFRPSLVYGPQRRGLFFKLVRTLSRWPAIPLVGSGRECLRPVHADDVAWAFAEALEKSGTIGGSYHLGGADEMSFRAMVECILRELKRNVPFIPVPLPICRALAVGGEMFLRNPPLTTDNIEGLAHAEEVDIGAAQLDLEFSPRRFVDGFRECLALGLLGGGG